MMPNREDMIEAVDAIQTERCGYLHVFDGQLRKSSFCDCKFGMAKAGHEHMGEKNGCPELRILSFLLSKMTDEEFQEICNRK